MTYLWVYFKEGDKMENVEKIKPTGIFTNYIFKTIPLAFDESMSYYETLCGLLNLLKNSVIPTVNNNADAIIELQNFVDNYFNNLNVQQEINNKLDQMAESGQLTDIIAQYLQLAGVLAFNTKNDLKNATNLSNGSFTKTYGDTTYNDGKGAFYKIRTLINTDVIDDDKLIALTNYPTLVGEKMQNYYLNNLNNRLNLVTNKKILFIGDSYLTMDNGTTGVIDYFKTISGITNVIYNLYSGVGFAYTVDNKNFVNLLNEVTSDNDVTDIIVCGGYNDQYVNPKSDILSAINNFCNIAKTKFPNAKVYIGCAGFTMEEDKRYSCFEVYNQYSLCNRYGAIYLNGVETVMHDTSLFVGGEDLTHPKEMGREMIATALHQSWKNGYYQTVINYTEIPLTIGGAASGGAFNLYGMIMNNMTFLVHTSPQTIQFSTHPSYTDIHMVDIPIGSLNIGANGSFLSPWKYNMYPIPVTCAVEDSSGYRTMNGKLQFNGNNISLVFEDVENSNWTDINGLMEIEINSFQAVFPTQMI